MNREYEKYIRCSYEELTKKEKENLAKLIDYYLYDNINYTVSELEKMYKSISKILIPSCKTELRKKITSRKNKEQQKLEKEITTVANLILSEQVNNYLDLLKLSSKTDEEIRKIFTNKNMALLDEEIREVVLEKLAKIQKEEYLYQKEKTIRIEKFRVFDEYIYLYLNSRYTQYDLSLITSVPKTNFNDACLFGFIKANYSQVIIDEIRAHGQVNKNIHGDRKCNKSVIKKPEIIKLVNDEIYKVGPHEHKILEIVNLFFQNYGSIASLMENIKQPSYNYILSSLMCEELEVLLKTKYYISLLNYLEIEKEMQTTPYPAKRKKVLKMCLEYLTKFNGNINKMLENTSYSFEEVCRCLHDKIVEKELGSEIYSKISESLKHYNEKEYVIRKLDKVKIKI